MRWSLFSLISLLALLIADVTALPTPQDDSLDLVLERRAATRPKPPKTLTASVKKSSSTYRNAAMQGKNPMFSVKSGRITKSQPPKKMPQGMHADHIFEAQTFGHAAKKAGHSFASLGSALTLIKNRINDPKNMAFVDPHVNKAKGRAHTAVQAGRAPAKDANLASYLKQTAAAGRSTAKDVNQILKDHKIKGIDVQKAHNDVLKAYGVKRRDYSDVDLD